MPALVLLSVSAGQDGHSFTLLQQRCESEKENTMDADRISKRKRAIRRSLRILTGVSALALFLPLPSHAQPSRTIHWWECLRQPAKWYAQEEAIRIADNLLLYQFPSGGWPKNIDMAQYLNAAQQEQLKAINNLDSATIDNSATHTQLRYLAKVYNSTKLERFKNSFDRGFEYVLKAQYPNGGWPQFYPLREGYYSRITFNDDAMIGVMSLLRDISRGRPDFVFVERERRDRAKVAVNKGIQCILRCQIKVGDELVAWCAQHDERNFRPAKARAYELSSISGAESVGVTEFLMGIEEPTEEIIQSIQSAVAWFNKVKIEGIKVVTVDDKLGPMGKNRVVVADPSAPPMWARFYEIGTNKPFFSSRDGIKRDSLSQISYERRNHYNWLGYWPQDLLTKEYPAWLVKHSLASAPQKNPAKEIPHDTSFTLNNTAPKVIKQYPHATPVLPVLPQGVRARENVLYAKDGDRELHLDLFVPARKITGALPAVILIHGGGWRSGSRQMEWPMAQRLAAAGYVTATVEYRLSIEALYPTGIHDLKAAIRWMRANASRYNIDPGKIAVYGCSAGGELAAFLGATGDMRKFEGSLGPLNYSSRVQAVVDLDGVLDFADPAESAKDTIPQKPSAGKSWFGASFKENPDLWREASPISYVGAKTPPILFVNSALPRYHAGRDAAIEKLNRLGIYSEVHTIPDTPHPFWLFHPWFDEALGYIVAFLDKTLKGKQR